MECLGIGDYGTHVPSELGNFSRKQRVGNGMIGTGMILSLTSQTKEYELQYINHGGASKNHSHSPVNPIQAFFSSRNIAEAVGTAGDL